MALLRIAVDPTLNAQRIGVTLDGERWVLRLRQTDRSQQYWLDVIDATGTVQLRNRCVVLNQPLFGQYRNGRDLPAGELVCLDLTRKNREPGPTFPIGKDHQLYYLEGV